VIRDSQLSTLFASIPVLELHTETGSVFAALPIPFATPHRIGKDRSGDPSVLICSRDPSHAQPPPLVLENLLVLPHVTCAITQPTGHTEQGLFTVITCRSRDVDTRDYFFWIAEHLIRAVGPAPSSAEVGKAVERLVELFRSLSRPPQNSIQGLWAELLLIANAPAPIEAIKSWRSMPQERYDFCAKRQRIEVKSALGAVRAHHFSLEQLNPPPGVSALIASVLLSRTSGGQNVFDLSEEIRHVIRADEAAGYRLQYIVGITLGHDRQSAEDHRFDTYGAVESLRFFDVSNIPSIPRPIPDEITDVRFRADLTHTLNAALGECAAQGGLFQAMIPTR